MLSVILYGRNDLHGYHYHKRLAISLNCIAEELTHENDEILFIDYNSPDDEPTLIEIIWDTLTEKTLSVLKTYRARARHHQRIKTHLPVCEPLARNIAIRRSNPNNKWILSTNTDMIFVPTVPNQSLSSIVEKLDEGRYELPRFELPENFWGSEFDRSAPEKIISFLREDAAGLGLETVVRNESLCLFDAPGDFQLIPRDMLFAIGGFDEKMVLGWHCDSNLCARLNLYDSKGAQSLEDKLSAFHCNHVKKITAFHFQKPAENDMDTFIWNVTTPYLKEQEKNWGAPEEQFEEILPSHGHRKLLQKTLGTLGPKRVEILNSPKHFNNAMQSPSTIFPYLLDHLYTLPVENPILYLGLGDEIPKLLRDYFAHAGIEKIIWTEKSATDFVKSVKDSSILIIDFTIPKGKSRKELAPVIKRFFQIVSKEKHHAEKSIFLGINLFFSELYTAFSKHIEVVNNNMVTGITYGTLKQRNPYLKRPTKKAAKDQLIYLTLRHFFADSEKIIPKIRMPKFLKIGRP